MPHSVKRAILLHNNPGLFNYLDGSLPTGNLVNLTTFKLTDYELQQWESTHSSVKSEIESLDDNVKHMFDDVDFEMLSQIANSAQMISSEEDLGVGLDDTVRFKTRDSDENTSIKDEIVINGGNITKFSCY
jgi:hypothetical protein